MGKDYPGPEGGTACLELDAFGGEDTNASVFQDIRTGVEGTFKLSFFLPVKVQKEELLRTIILSKSIGEAKKSLP